MFDMDDEKLQRLQRHFMEELARDVSAANREVINEAVSALSRQGFMELARVVARKRAAYLLKAIELSRFESGSTGETAVLADLPSLRVAFYEARDAFAALERAIERGYIDIQQ